MRDLEAETMNDGLTSSTPAELYLRRSTIPPPQDADLLELNPVTGKPLWRCVLESAGGAMFGPPVPDSGKGDVVASCPSFLERLSW